MTAENMCFARLFSGSYTAHSLSQLLSPELAVVEQVTFDQIPPQWQPAWPRHPGGVLFGCKVLSDSFLQTHGLQHARTSLSPSTVCSNSSPLTQWCHPTISLCLAFTMIQHTLAIWLWKSRSLIHSIKKNY